jgi:hypothetical protein
MQDNPSTDNTDNKTQDPLIDRDDWEIALEPFEGHSYAALRLGFNIAMLRQQLDAQMFKCRPVIETLDLAMEVLFPYTSFHNTSFDLFIRLTDGKLTFEEEQMLHALGIKF